MKKVIHKILCQADFFSTPPILRSRSEPYSSSLCLSIFSIILLALFLWLFATGLINCINLDNSQMNVKAVFEKNFDQQNLTNIMFGVTITTGYDTNGSRLIADPSQYRKYFAFYASYLDQNHTFNYSFLKPCRSEQWKLLGDDYQAQFDSNLLSQAFCPTEMWTSYNVSIDDIFLYITVYPCVNETEIVCKSQQQIQNVYFNTVNQFNSFTVSVYYLSPVVQIDNPDPIKYIVDYKKYTSSKKTAKIAFLKYQQSTITTDKTLWPIVKDESKVQAYLPKQSFYASYEFDLRDPVSNSIMVIQAYRSPNIMIYQRKVNTIDQNISYVGGLLGIILIILRFFFNSYNQYKYELRVAETSFNFDTDGNKFREGDMNFFMYIKYSLFDWITYMCCHDMEWEDCRQIDATKQEAVNMLDIQKLFRRLEFMEKIISKQTHQGIIVCMTLIEPDSIEQTKKKRRILQYYQEVIKLQSAATVEDAINDSAISFKYLDSLKDKYESRKVKKKAQSILDSLRGFSQQIEEKETDGRQTQQQISSSLMFDLKLEQVPKTCEKISHYSLIALQAADIKLSPQFIQIEKEMTKCFIALSIQRKALLMMKIPLLIIHRLRLAAMKMRKQASKQVMNENQRGNQLQKAGESDILSILQGVGLINNQL